jgi:hypothetical protein
MAAQQRQGVGRRAHGGILNGGRGVFAGAGDDGGEGGTGFACAVSFLLFRLTHAARGNFKHGISSAHSGNYPPSENDSVTKLL